jgi:hypothetical protein
MSLSDGQSNRSAEQLAARRTLLDKWLRNNSSGQPSVQRIPQRSGQDPLPLSFAQQRLWFIHQVMPDNGAYVIPLVLRFTGMLNIQALEQSINTIIERH